MYNNSCRVIDLYFVILSFTFIFYLTLILVLFLCFIYLVIGTQDISSFNFIYYSEENVSFNTAISLTATLGVTNYFLTPL